MSEQESVGNRWGDHISEERQAELKVLADLQREYAGEPAAERSGSYFAGENLTGADVFWLASYALVTPTIDIARAQYLLRSWREAYPVLDHPSVDLVGANLDGERLQRAYLARAQLQEVSLGAARLQGADLSGAQLQSSTLRGARLQRAGLGEAHMQEANLSGARLQRAYLYRAELQGADLTGAYLRKADLRGAQLQGANLVGAQLQGADLRGADFQGADLSGAQLQGADLSAASLEQAKLTGVFFDIATHLNRAVFTGASFDQVMFDNTNLTVVDWSTVTILGDEVEARKSKDKYAQPKDRATHLGDYQAAVRANRLLALALRAQGLNENADRYAYRAQLMQRVVLRRQAFLPEKGERIGLSERLRKFATYLGSGLLDLIAGYGYRPGRSILAYAFFICAFAGLYLLNSQFASPHLRWDEALVLSISSFHGRGFFTTGVSLGDTLARLAAGEAILGLLLEITFIATFTNRFFAR